jgi:hypothetical protein
MRILLAIVLVLTIATALWCAAGYVSAKPQQIETRAELLQARETGLPISNQDIGVHVARIGHHGTNWGIAAGMASAAALGALACLIATFKSTEK